MAQTNPAIQQLPKQQSFLPLQLATKYYIKWDCQIQVKSTPNGYYKCLQGQGQVQFSNGNKYKGNFHNGLMHGNGQFTWANGLKYKGPFVNNGITGNGVYEWEDGSWYKGQLLNGKRHGKGEYFCSKDNSKYHGDWKQGVRHGMGLLQFNEQTCYEGQFSQSFRHGKGKMKYSSGNIYQGDWKGDKKCGYGIMNWFTQNQKYEGEWMDDLQHGIGTYYWFDGKIQYKIVKSIYKGNWAQGERHGYGSFFYSNGCRYEGYFSHNQKHGEGLVMDDNGNVKLECFDKDKLVYTIPDNGQALSATVKQNTNQQSVQKQKQKQKQKKQPQLLPKLSQTKLQSSSSAHVQSISSTTRGVKLLGTGLKSKQGSSSISQLPQINQQKQAQFPASTYLSQKETRLKVQENTYTKCLDIPIMSQSKKQLHLENNQMFMINEEIMNLLLRENSHLRQWYKHCSMPSSTTGGNNASKDFYTGVTIENLSKLVKDLKIIDDFVTIPKINREFFYRGWKATYDITLPNQSKLEFVKEYLQKAKGKIKMKQSNCSWDKLFNNEQINYSNIQWVHYTQYIHNLQKETQINKQNIDLNLFNDIHSQKIILYRHFVSYLLRIAYLQTLKLHIIKKNSHTTFQKEFRHNLQKLFKTINSIYDNAQRQAKGIQSTDNLTFVSKQRASFNISQDFSKINEELFAEITKNYRNLNNFADNTVNVKILYQLLDRFGVLKQPTEKMLFLQKIQRFMEPEFPKHSLLRKEMKSHFPALQKVVYTSPYFQRILSYSLVQREFEQLLYLAVNRKIISNSKQEAVKRYREAIDQVIHYVRKQMSLNNSNQPLKSTLKIKKQNTIKDKRRLQLVREDEQKKAILKQAQRKRVELKKEEIECSRMQREDFKWEEEIMEEQSDGYFD